MNENTRTDAPTMFAIEDLRVEFHTSRGVASAVNGVSFSVKQGERLAIVGESGCGKTATLMASMKLLPSPPAHIVGGRVMIDGEDLLSMNRKELNDARGNNVSVVFQDALSAFNPVLTVGRQISEGARQQQKLSKKEAHELAVDMLTRVGVPDPEQRAKQYPHQLSGGMRQRAMIAMALAGDPKVLLADEPTTALDVTVQAQILDLVRSFEDLSIVWVTHDLAVVAGIADRVVVMYSGYVVEEGPVADIFENAYHPYTRALLSSIPKPGDTAAKELTTIPGSPPDLVNLPKGCAFFDRCPIRVEKCKTAVPKLVEMGPDHASACWVTQSEQELKDA